MRNKISKKLTLSNAIIVVVALFVFCMLAMLIFNNYVRQSTKEQLITENHAAYRLAALNVIVGNNLRGNNNSDDEDNEYIQPNIYNNLSDSFSIVLIQSDKTLEYEILYSSVGEFEAKIDVFALEARIEEAEDNVIALRLNDVNYYCTMTSSKSIGKDQMSVAVVSLIPISSVQQVNRQYIVAFIITATVLVLLSIVVMSIISSRITRPIGKLTKLTKDYSQRDFKSKYIANTNDEIEDLSKAISAMADSLEEQDKQREKMFRNISHELKTPLTAIYGYAEGIKNGIFVGADEPLDIIMSESLRIKKLTEDIIYLSKLESHIEVFKFDKADISEIMVKSIHSIESIAIMNDVDIRFMPSKIDEVSVDEDKIHRALINVLSNCVKYTNDTIKIEINDNIDNVEIVVSDNGSGFKQEDINNLLSGMTKEKSNGSGIGLSIVNEIIIGHRGRFFIGNSKNGGAVFTIVLNK